MKILLEDFPAAYHQLRAAMEDGYTLVAYPKDRECLVFADFIFYDSPGDGLEEYVQGSQMLVLSDVYDLVRTLELIGGRRDHDGVVDVELSMERFNSELAAVARKLETMGLSAGDALGPISEWLVYGHGPDLDVVKEFAGREVVFEPVVALSEGSVKLYGYGVLCPSKKREGSFDIVHFPWNVPVERPAQVFDNLEELQRLAKAAGGLSPLNNYDMDAKNLENLKSEMVKLGFSEDLIGQMEVKMAANEPRFILYDELQSEKGRVEMALHFNQSRTSEFYYFNKFDVVLEKQPPLAPGEKYFVTSQRQGDDAIVREFEMPSLAVKEFNSRMAASEEIRGAAQIYAGPDLNSSRQLATMADGKILEVETDFYRTLRNPAPGQTFYVERGNGFTLSQAVNMLSGRSVFRDDILDIKKQEYSAWAKLDFDAPRDRGGNFHQKNFTEGYGFDLSAVLERFDFKELSNPEWRAALEDSLRNGDRAVVNVDMDGKAAKILVEAVPEFKQLNLYSLEGKSIKRENHVKEEQIAEVGASKDKLVKKGKEQEEGLSV